MRSKCVTFVTTTINVPKFIEGYFDDAKKHGYDEGEVRFVVVGDLKTHSKVEKYCEKVSDDYPYEVEYLGVEDQRVWLENKGFYDLQSFIPHNSLQRRNIGFLKAYEDGADVIVSLDDDNLANDEDIVGKFQEVGEEVEVEAADAENGWFNCCSMLKYENQASKDIYPRGFPYSKRNSEQNLKFTKNKKKLAVRAGLWIDIPDVDVVTHLEKSPIAESLRDEYEGKLVSLSKDNFCPINTQNTGFDAQMLPLLYAVTMGDEVKGMEIDRFDDIWLGFFAEKILHHLDEAVAFGRPISEHDRNTHHLLGELEHEAIGFRLNEELVEILENISLSENDYISCYEEIIIEFRNQLSSSDMDYEFEAYFKKMLDGMEIWKETCEELMSVERDE